MSTLRLLVLAACLGVFPVRAEEAAAALDAALLEQVKGLSLNAATTATPHRVEVVVGQLDPRLHLAPCQNIEPYLPVNSKPWGKSRIGLRCKQGAVAWNVYLPITVKVFGPALVMAQGAAAGHVIAAADLGQA
ncbi:MAG: flagellar biosynthesis protein FlgA, partial [Pseudomonadota bacterium]|nr:flagellar biosynthesis protein FlgA [Pseudomonadota bacterium]